MNPPVYIYLDESGDLGFSSRSSKYFVIAALLTKDRLQIEKCITKVRKERLPKKYKKISELKYHKPNILYKFLCGSLIGNIFRKYHITRKIDIFVDRSLTGINKSAFDEYIGYKALINNGDVFDPNNLEIFHVNSVQDKCIQAVDFVVGAIARNYEHGDPSLYEIIDNNVEIALDFFKGRIK